jgi:hypothetical protein
VTWSLPLNLCQVLGVRVLGPVPQLPIWHHIKKKWSCPCPCLEGIQPNTMCDFIMWCLSKHRDSLTFFSSYCILGESCCVLLAGRPLTAVKCLLKKVLMLMSLTPDILFVYFILWVDNYVAYSHIYPTRCNITQFILSGNCSTCFGWYHHPSSGAQTTVSDSNCDKYQML